MKTRFLIATAVGLMVLGRPAAWGVLPRAEQALPNFDKRQAMAQPPVDSLEQRQAAALLQARVHGVRIERDKILGAPRWISAPRGFLTGPGGRGGALSASPAGGWSADDPHVVIKEF